MEEEKTFEQKLEEEGINWLNFVCSNCGSEMDGLEYINPIFREDYYFPKII